MFLALSVFKICVFNFMKQVFFWEEASKEKISKSGEKISNFYVFKIGFKYLFCNIS